MLKRQFDEIQKRIILDNIIANSQKLQTMSIETKMNEQFKKYQKMKSNLCYITQAIYSQHKSLFRKDLIYQILEQYISFKYIEYTSI